MQKLIYALLFLTMVASMASAQIQAPDADLVGVANYAAPPYDAAFLFCTDDSLRNEATLMVRSEFGISTDFSWEVYDPNQSTFVPYVGSVNSDTIESTISNLADGCYKVTLTAGGMSVTHQAWALNNWLFVEPEITESNCEYMVAEFTIKSKQLNYFDVYNHTPMVLNKEHAYQWSAGGSDLSKSKTLTIYREDLPCEDKEYTIEVSDNMGCSKEAKVLYESIIPCADFTFNPASGEAPLEVNFTNNSINYGSDSIEWIFFKNNIDIGKELSDNPGAEVDSVWFTLYEDAPIFTYERTGQYVVDLVVRSFEGCRDTMRMPRTSYIDVFASLIEAPNFFTPNGDGDNDYFLLQTQSLKNIEVIIFNSWGRKVHVYKDGNIRSSEETNLLSIWDGTINGRKASPGVYFYIVNALGRDDVEYKDEGFFHLFTTKDARP